MNFTTSGGALNTLELLNGSTIVMEWNLPSVSESTNPAYSEFHVCDLNIVGSANTAMTLQSLTTGSFVYENIGLVGYDAM